MSALSQSDAGQLLELRAIDPSQCRGTRLFGVRVYCDKSSSNWPGSKAIAKAMALAAARRLRARWSNRVLCEELEVK